MFILWVSNITNCVIPVELNYPGFPLYPAGRALNSSSSANNFIMVIFENYLNFKLSQNFLCKERLDFFLKYTHYENICGQSK